MAHRLAGLGLVPDRNQVEGRVQGRDQRAVLRQAARVEEVEGRDQGRDQRVEVRQAADLVER